jgi:hypothetical protein
MLLLNINNKRSQTRTKANFLALFPGVSVECYSNFGVFVIPPIRTRRIISGLKHAMYVSLLDDRYQPSGEKLFHVT